MLMIVQSAYSDITPLIPPEFRIQMSGFKYGFSCRLFWPLHVRCFSQSHQEIYIYIKVPSSNSPPLPSPKRQFCLKSDKNIGHFILRLFFCQTLLGGGSSALTWSPNRMGVGRPTHSVSTLTSCHLKKKIQVKFWQMLQNC